MTKAARIISAFSCTLLAACASSGLNVRPENIPVLEQRVTAEPNNADLATSLGTAYFNAKRYDDARSTLTRVVALPNAPANASLYLGLANEELKDWTGARNAYESYLQNTASGGAREQIRARLALVARQQLRHEAKLVLEREQQMSEEPPTPRTVAVMPFRLVGVSEELAPLQTALTDMIITDLSVSPAITSVERTKISAIIDEMLLSQAGLAEQNTGARVGRLLKAEHVVQGVLAQSAEQEVRMDATILNTARRESAGNFGQNQRLDAIFDLEKQIVFNIFNTVGVTLTAAEREKINENRTGNLLAFLAYGRGLDAMDRGNYQQAATHFRQATQLDPSFQRVQAQQQEAAQLQAATDAPTAEVAQDATPSAGDTEDLAKSMNNEINQTPATDLTSQPAAPQAPTQGVQQTQNQSANINNAQGNTGGLNNAGKATIRLVITRPGA